MPQVDDNDDELNEDPADSGMDSGDEVAGETPCPSCGEKIYEDAERCPARLICERLMARGTIALFFLL